MAKKSLVVKTEKAHKALKKALALGKKPKYATRVYNRCQVCGRPRGYLKDFGMCRICFRELANRGLLNGVRKSSW